MNKYITFNVLLLAFFLGLGFIFLIDKNKALQEELSLTKNNEKALILNQDSLQSKVRVYKFTVEQLSYYNDSILYKLDSIRKELKIKDKNLLALQYSKIEATRRDTIVFSDTIFKEPTLSIDTIKGDSWYNVKLKLEYPNKIEIEPTFVSERSIIISTKKETVNPPKKFFLLRWFQKKHLVTEVNIIENNPYVKNKQQKYIEIIK